jgi:dihydroorotate dehydrogenase electron transfer subunit
MMHAVATECRRRSVACFVSLETYMACGYGVCNGCSVAVHSAGRFAGKVYAKTCVAGPVFAAEELAW